MFHILINLLLISYLLSLYERYLNKGNNIPVFKRNYISQTVDIPPHFSTFTLILGALILVTVLINFIFLFVESTKLAHVLIKLNTMQACLKKNRTIIDELLSKKLGRN